MSEQKERQRAQQVRNSRIAEIMKLQAENTRLRAALAEETQRADREAAEVAVQVDARREIEAALAEAERERDALRAKIELAHDRLCLLPEECDLVTACEHAMSNALESDARAERADVAVLRYRCQVDALEQLGVAAHKAWTEKLERAEADLAAAREVMQEIVSAHDDANVETPAEDVAEHMADTARAFLERTTGSKE